MSLLTRARALALIVITSLFSPLVPGYSIEAVAQPIASRDSELLGNAGPLTAPLAACIAGLHSAWVSQSSFPNLSPGQTKTVEIDFQNIGCETWDSRVRLGTWNPIPGQDQPSVLGGASGCSVVTDWVACNRIAPNNGSSFGYGATAKFVFTLKAPASAGTYYVYLRPLIEGVQWMEDQGVYMQVNDLICTNRSPHDNGARQTHTAAGVSGITIISSSILEYDPVYTGFNDTGTNASILLVNQGPPQQWAQLGWIKSKLDGAVTRREVFLEFNISWPSQNYFQFWPARTVGTATWYQIQYAGNSVFDFFVGGSLFSEKSGWGPPSEYQMIGETHDYEDQGPGALNQHVTFDSSQYYAGGWVNVTSAMYADTSVPWGFSNPWTGHYEMWDGSCAN